MENTCYSTHNLFKCNGFDVKKAPNCLGVSCPLYRWSPYTKVSSLIILNLEKPISKRKGKPFPKSKAIKGGDLDDGKNKT